LRTLLFIALLSGMSAFGQNAGRPPGNGDRYENLRPEQQKLIQAWLAEYEKITGEKRDIAAYDSLPLSARTTFDAVTHALLSTKLTSGRGRPLGTALDLVELVAGVQGEAPDTRGDHQFRIYVKLKPDALSRLYKCREFRRTGDNTIYHIGYPVNFRQQGGAPSIQISVTRAGRRADIDVDYRSSSGPQALVNGHLTAANSDVRAGTNNIKHASRWGGFAAWWKDLLGMFGSAPAQEPVTLAQNVQVPSSPKVKDSAPVQEAVADFYKSWLVDGKPQDAMAYVSVNSYACLAEFQTGESIDSGLAALRIIQHMRLALASFGKSNSLAEAIQGAPLYAPGGKPVVHDKGKLFSLEHLPDDTARTMDCRVRLRTNLAEELPKVSHEFGDTYAAITRLLKQPGAPTYMTQIWKKEEGAWKIVSWFFEDPIKAAATPMIKTDEAAPVQRQARAQVAGSLPETADKFLRLWLVEHSYDHAADYFAPQCSGCADVHNAGSTKAFLASVGGLVPRKPQLADLITAVQYGHPQMEAVEHANGKAYLLARVSDDLAAMSECHARKVGSKAASGPGKFRENKFQTIFGLKDAQGMAGAVQLQWTMNKGRWWVTSAQIVSR
jgi:hypothetical protein